MIDRADFLNDSIEKVLKAKNLMYGVDVCYLHEEGREDGVLRDWICLSVGK